MSKNEMQWLCNGIKIAETRTKKRTMNGYTCKPDFGIVLAKLLLCDKIYVAEIIFYNNSANMKRTQNSIPINSSSRL